MFPLCAPYSHTIISRGGNHSIRLLCDAPKKGGQKNVCGAMLFDNLAAVFFLADAGFEKKWQEAALFDLNSAIHNTQRKRTVKTTNL